MEYLIRPVEEKDVQELVRLCASHAAYERANYNREGKDALLSNALFSVTPQLYGMVVESQQQLAGYCTYTFDFSTWDAGMFLYLDCLYLEPEFRGYGIGEEIMKKLEVIAKDKGCVNIQWQTPWFNERAIKFYNRIGGTGSNKVRFSMYMNKSGD